MDADDEPGLPGQLDKDGRPFFFPSNQSRPADALEQRDGFIPHSEYQGHTDSVKDICLTGEDSFGRMRFVSTDGKGAASWLELSDGDSEKLASRDHIVNALVFIPALNVVAAASGDNLLVFDGRTLRMAATLPTSKKVLLQLEYNHARDEIISGGSDGCFVWRLEAIPCELYALEVVPFELRLLRGFKGCSHWAGKMVWDEASQVIITIDGMKVKTYDAVTAIILHTIRKAHDSPVTAGLWMGESQNIVTGSMDGGIKVWACQHTHENGGFNANRGRRRRRRRRPCRHRGRMSKTRHGQSPALVQQFGGHSGTLTGLVRHCLNRSYIISCGVDSTLRVWDVDRLAPVTSIGLPRAAASLWALSTPGGRCRVVYSEAEGTLRTMVVHQVCQPLSFDTEGARNVCYFPPLADSTEEPSDVSAIKDCDKSLVCENWARDPPEAGLLLVQLNQGLWGLISELTTTETCANEADNARGIFTRVQSDVSSEEEGDDDAARFQDGNTTSSLFYAWPPLSCVVERYSHHILSRRRRKVICLADSGVLDTYLFGPARREANKVQSRKVDLHANGATATCMCLLPDTPARLVAALDRVIASYRPSHTPSGGPSPGDGRGGSDMGEEESCRDRGCSRIGASGRTRRLVCEKFDQVVAIGTSSGAVLFVETVVNGTTLDFLEGVFASKVFHVAFCSASTEDDIRGSELVPGNLFSTACAEDAERLVCAGYNTNGTVTIKGLTISSLAETFRLHLVEVPTCVRVASRRPILAVGFADGALNAFSFRKDRIQDLENGALIGAHRERIHTISFSTRFRCMATGSVDGHIIIWDLSGQQLHNIHLQKPALAVEFMEVSGDLFVSSSSGMSCIPPSRWCPLRLLVAKERADRRAAAAVGISSSLTSSGDYVSRQVLSSATHTSGEGFVSMMMQAIGTVAGERGVRVRDSELTLCKRPRHANEGRGCAGDRQLIREGVQALDGKISGKSETVCAPRKGRGLIGEVGDGEEPSRSNDERECTPPAVAGLKDWPGGLTPSRSNSHLTSRKASAPPDRRKFSILDRMKAKFSSMPTSPPPPTSRTTKARERLTSSVPSTKPASPPVLVQHCGDEESYGRVPTGERCHRKSVIPTSACCALLTSAPNRRDANTISTSDNTPAVEGAEPGSGASLLAQAQTPNAARFPLSGSFLNGIILPRTAILDQDVAAMNHKGTLSTTMPPQRCTLPSEDGVCTAGKTTIAVTKTSVPLLPRDSRSLPSGLPPTVAPSSTEKRAAACTTPGFTVSRYTAPKPTQRQSPKRWRGLHSKTKEIGQRHHGPGSEGSTTEATNGKHHPLPDCLSSGQTVHVPAGPICRPTSGEDPPDSVARNLVEPSDVALNARKRCRQGLAVAPAPAVTSKQRNVPPAWTPPAFSGSSGAGMSAAVATKDKQNVVPTISIPRAMGKPFFVANLVDLVSRSPPSPSPPVSRGGRAFGDISPPSWSVDCGIGRLLSTPRMESTLSLPQTAATPNSEGETPFRNRSGVRIAGSSAVFFPVRPRAGRRTPVLAGRERCLKAEAR